MKIGSVAVESAKNISAKSNEVIGGTFKEILHSLQPPNINNSLSKPLDDLINIQNQVFNYHIKVEMLSRLTESCSATVRRLQSQ